MYGLKFSIINKKYLLILKKLDNVIVKISPNCIELVINTNALMVSFNNHRSTTKVNALIKKKLYLLILFIM